MEKTYVSTTFLPESFYLKKNKVPVQANPSNKTGFSYGFGENPEATHSLFLRFAGQLPAAKGVALILGINKDNTSRIIDLLDSPYNLREDFLVPKITEGPKSISRYRWARMQLEVNGFVSLKIQLAHAA